MANSLLFGNDLLDIKAALEHGLVIGATGSGKTTILGRSMFSTMRGTKRRALAFDAKQDLIPVFAGLGRWADVRILDPFDQRSFCWDIAKDICDPLAARQFATLLIPGNKAGASSDVFWDQACRDVVFGVTSALMSCTPAEESWTFRDVILAALYSPYLRFLLEQPVTREGDAFILGSRLCDSYLNGDEKTVLNLRTSLNATLGIYEPLAAAWQLAYEGTDVNPPRRFSLAEWAKSCEIVVLGNDESARAATEPINRLLMNRACEMLLANKDLTASELESGDGFTFIWLDEAREVGKVDMLPRLMLKGRSKGVSVFLGSQTRTAMTSVYGEGEADMMLGQVGNIGVLRLNDPATAEWAAGLFGRGFIENPSTGYSLGPEGGSTNSQFGQTEGYYVPPADFLHLPKTSRETGLTGFFKNSYRSVEEGFRVHIDWDPDISAHLPVPSKHPDHAAVVPRERKGLILRPWDVTDWQRLGFSGEPPRWSSTDSGEGWS